MKKYTLVLMSLVLVLATSACSLPFLNNSAEPASAAVTETAVEATPLPGMAVYAANGVTINLPESYELKDVDTMVSGNETFQQLYQQYGDAIVLLAVDTASTTAIQDSVLVVKNETFASVPLGLLSTVAGSLLGDSATVLAQEELSLGGRDTLRLQTSVSSGDSPVTLVVYVFKEAGKLWMVGFLVDQEQMADPLPTSDAAVASFTVVNVE